MRNTLRNAPPAAYMTADGRVSMRDTVENSMPNASRVQFTIPLYAARKPMTSAERYAAWQAAELECSSAQHFANGIDAAEKFRGTTP